MEHRTLEEILPARNALHFKLPILHISMYGSEQSPCLFCPFLRSQYPATLVNEPGVILGLVFCYFATSCFLVIVLLAEMRGIHPTVRNADSEGGEINTAHLQAWLLTSCRVSDKAAPQWPSCVT